jgi:hypothetical protein
MHAIDIYAELHWAVSRPQLDFRLNGSQLLAQMQTVSRQQYQENVIYHTIAESLSETNLLEIELYGKNNNLITADSDHWVDIRNVMIDDVSADTMLASSEFRHNMPKSWVEEMQKQNIEILSLYCPGSTLRLNGVMSWQFSESFTNNKLLHIWQQKE